MESPKTIQEMLRMLQVLPKSQDEGPAVVVPQSPMQLAEQQRDVMKRLQFVFGEDLVLTLPKQQ
jgi:hypothetical protein